MSTHPEKMAPILRTESPEPLGATSGLVPKNDPSTLDELKRPGLKLPSPPGPWKRATLTFRKASLLSKEGEDKKRGEGLERTKAVEKWVAEPSSLTESEALCTNEPSEGPNSEKCSKCRHVHGERTHMPWPLSIPREPYNGDGPITSLPAFPKPIHCDEYPPSAVSYICKGRLLQYASCFYYLADYDEFLMCTHCFAAHVRGSSIEDRFNQVEKPYGGRCRFNTPRMKQLLDAAKKSPTDGIGALSGFIKTRASMGDCPRSRAAGLEAEIKWYMEERVTREMEIAVCQPCFEDILSTTPLASKFKEERPIPGLKLKCGLYEPFPRRTVLALNGGSPEQVCRFWLRERSWRKTWPVCPSKGFFHTNTVWYTSIKKLHNHHKTVLIICRACLYDHIRYSRFRREFKQFVPTFNNVKYVCALGHFDALKFAWSTAIDHGTIEMWLRAAERVLSAHYGRTGDRWPTLGQAATERVHQIPPPGPWRSWETIASTTKRTERNFPWHTIGSTSGPSFICGTCYACVLEPLGLHGLLSPRIEDPPKGRSCPLCPGSPLRDAYLGSIYEAVETGVAGRFLEFVRRSVRGPENEYRNIEPCPHDDRTKDRYWYGWADTAPGFTPNMHICEECWAVYARQTSLAQWVPEQLKFRQRGTRCCLHSPRVREWWTIACQRIEKIANNPHLDPAQRMQEREAAVADLRIMVQAREKVYEAAVIPRRDLHIGRIFNQLNAAANILDSVAKLATGQYDVAGHIVDAARALYEAKNAKEQITILDELWEEWK